MRNLPRILGALAGFGLVIALAWYFGGAGGLTVLFSLPLLALVVFVIYISMVRASKSGSGRVPRATPTQPRPSAAPASRTVRTLRIGAWIKPVLIIAGIVFIGWVLFGLAQVQDWRIFATTPNAHMAPKAATRPKAGTMPTCDSIGTTKAWDVPTDGSWSKVVPVPVGCTLQSNPVPVGNGVYDFECERSPGVFLTWESVKCTELIGVRFRQMESPTGDVPITHSIDVWFIQAQ